MLPLQRGRRVPHNSPIVLNLVDSGDGKAHIEHVLVVADDGLVAAELVIETILSVGEDVFLILDRGRVRMTAVWLGSLLVLAQI